MLRAASFLLLAGVPASLAAPQRPLRAEEVLVRAPQGGARLLGELAELQARLERDPRDLDAATRLAWGCVRMGEERDAPRWFRYARRAVAPWWSAEERPYEVVLLAARLYRQALDFDLAIEELQALLTADPGDARAWQELAELQLAQGDYALAFRNCLPLVQSAPGLPASLCIGRASAASFQADRVAETLEKELAKAPEAPPRQRLEALRVLARIDRDHGRTHQAEARLREALAMGVAEARVRIDLAELLLEAGRPAEVAELAAGAEESTWLLLLRALAARAAGEPEGWSERLLRARFGAARAMGRPDRLEPEARFALEIEEDAEQALWLSRSSWELRRSPQAARVFLAAARGAGRPEAATPVLDWVRGARVTVPWLLQLVEEWEVPRP